MILVVGVTEADELALGEGVSLAELVNEAHAPVMSLHVAPLPM